MSRFFSGAFLLATLVAASPAVPAVEIHSVDVQHEDARYHVSMRVTLDAPADATYAVFVDLPLLTQINPAVRNVQVLETLTDGGRRVSTDVRACVSFFCRHLKQVQDMRFEPRASGGRVRAEVISERSDFRFGEASWDFRDCGAGRTCLDFDARMEPAFWVPPLLGPWLIKRKLHEEAIQTSRGLERLARAPTTPTTPAPTP